VAQEQLPSLLKVAEALRVKGLFEDDSLNNTATSSVGGGGGGMEREYRGDQPPALSALLRPHQHPSSTHQTHRSKSPSPTSARGEADSYGHQRHHSSYSSGGNYRDKSPLPSPQGSEPSGGNRENNVGMWPPLVMPLHLGAFESALREREQALALYGAIQRGGEDSGSGNGNGHGNNADLPSGGSSGSSNGATNKRKRLSSSAASSSAASIPPPEVDSAPLLRTVLGPHHGKSGHHHHHHGDIPGLFPFRLSGAGGATGSGDGGPADERSHLSYLPMAMAYAEVCFFFFIIKYFYRGSIFYSLAYSIIIIVAL